MAWLATQGGQAALSSVAQQGKEASGQAASGSAGAAAQGGQFASAGGSPPSSGFSAAVAPAGTLPQSGYDPMSIRQRLMAFRG
jgi:hypothetical protein